MKRRLFVASLSASSLVACGPVKDQLTTSLHGVLDSAQVLNHAVIGTRGDARLYTEADIDKVFRVNGLDTPSDVRYADAARDDFGAYRLPVAGLVEHPHTFTLAELRALPLKTQITRHDCVEGWSVIGKWTGVPLATIVAMAQPKSNARYVVFHCFDKDESGTEYYESLDLHQAAHPQTLLALDLNDKPIDPDHGAPVRLRIPTQLGYKSAKWVRRIELAAAFPVTASSKGGYWEDQGYEWYAGI
ncbi:MAG TPA: molybdopterin-dependent oxidoreductase [Candidatus Aquilonibacter sp.]